MKIEYLLFNLLVILGPLISPLIYKKTKKPHFKAALFAVAVSSLVFIIWDQLVTGFFWFFNPRFITGIKILNLPIEEILFFFTVSYACLFLWVNYKTLKMKEVNYKLSQARLSIIVMILYLLSFYFTTQKMFYTASVFLVPAFIIIFDTVIKTKLISSKRFLHYLMTINLFTLIFNFYLTARPIVIYNNLLKTGFNILTIPIEDFIYGLCLIALTVILYEKKQSNSK